MKKFWNSLVESLKVFFNCKQKGKTKRPMKKKTLIILCVVLAIVLVLLIVGAIYMDSMLGLIGRQPGNETMSSSEYEEWLKQQSESRPAGYEAIDPDNIDWGDIANPLEMGEGIANILLIGQDRRSGEGRARSDAMILCTINKNTNTVTMTSFMRDMYVQIPGYQDNRINTSYLFGGSSHLNKTLMTNFGVTVHGNIEVDFYGCMEAIDVLGGVDIELTQAEANYLNKRGNWEVTNEAKWNLQAGVNHLTGSQAVAYARIRAIGSDYGRTERQRKVLSALLAGCKGLSVTEMDSLFRKILPNITTDMTNSELLGYVWAVFNMLSDLKIENARIPADGTYRETWIRGMAVLLPDLEANRAVLAEIMKGK